MPRGRPRKVNSRGRIISIRLTQQEFTALQKVALAWGVSVAEYIRSESLSSIGLDPDPNTTATADEVFAAYLNAFSQHRSPYPPPPLKAALEAVGAHRLAEIHGDDARFQLWTTGHFEGAVNVYGNDSISLWMPDEGGLSGLLHGLRHLLGGTGTAQFIYPAAELSPPAPLIEELQAESAWRLAECPGPFRSWLQFWTTAERAEVMLVFKHDGEIEVWRLFRDGYNGALALLDALRAYLR
jgi:hypothetical protein